MDETFAFYAGTLRSLCDDGLVSTSDRVLAVAAGELDMRALQSTGFSDVVISNMDTRMNSAAFAPFEWAFEDAERISYEDKSFDFVVVHAGLHHCRVPHQALAEMYRVCRKGVLLVEARDSLLLRTSSKIGLTTDYEIEAVVGNDYRFGGLRNTATPNYVYRWTEREVEKIAHSIDPTGPLAFRYFYSVRLPFGRYEMHKNKAAQRAAAILAWPTKLVARLFKKQGNLFAAFIGRPRQNWPWIDERGTIKRDWAEQRFAGSEETGGSS